MGLRIIGILVLLLAFVGCQNEGMVSTPTAFNTAVPSTDTPMPMSTPTITSLPDVSIVMARGIDADGCAVDVTTQFDRSEILYVVWDTQNIPGGTEVYAVLFYDNSIVLETDHVFAPEDFDNVCVYFMFEPTTVTEVMQRGPYRTEFYQDDQFVGSTNFVIE